MGNPYTNISAAPAGDANGYMTSADMKVGAYTLDAGTAPTFGARHVTCTRTVVDAADTAGTLVLVGEGPGGEPITETLIPGAHTVVVTGSKFFRKLTSATGAGWVIGGTDEDTLEIGWDNVNAVAAGNGTLHSIIINTTAAGVITVADAKGTIAVIPSNVAVGTQFEYDVSYTGYLRVEPAAASNITVVHSGSSPVDYAR